jgi:hypothetical protein
MNFRPVNDPDHRVPRVRVPNVTKVRVTSKRTIPTRNKGVLHDVWGTKGDDPTERMPRRKPRATKVRVTVYASGRGVERKRLAAHIERCNQCGRNDKWANVQRSNVGYRCRLHRPNYPGEMGQMRMKGTGRWA